MWLKTHYFSQFITKMGFSCKILSLNDLTPSPISRPGTHCLQWQRAKARANLWWRHEPFPGETSIALRPCAGKAGVAKRSWWCLGIIPFYVYVLAISRWNSTLQSEISFVSIHRVSVQYNRQINFRSLLLLAAQFVLVKPNDQNITKRGQCAQSLRSILNYIV